MIEKVVKEQITKLSELRVGQMITQDYQKPTQRALTVVEVGSMLRTPTVWLEDRRGEEIAIIQLDLDAETYDLRTTPKRRSL